MPTTQEKILSIARSRKALTTRALVRVLGLSRQTVADHLSRLVQKGILEKTGSTRNAAYRLAAGGRARPLRVARLQLNKRLIGLEEDRVFAEVDFKLQLKRSLPKGAYDIISYAFTEMLNNAIDHSRSKQCRISFEVDRKCLSFAIRDYGIGAFANVQKTFWLPTELDAMGHLFKGKQTTDPARHSGEGIFFTSRIADIFVIRSHEIEATKDNDRNDVFAKSTRRIIGTEVRFSLRVHTKKKLSDVFREFSNENFEFEKNRVNVRLSDAGGTLSRSEAKRLVHGLEKFRHIVFDFSGVVQIGQGFADEIFRVFASAHPDVELTFSNTTPAVSFMITRALGTNGSRE